MPARRPRQPGWWYPWTFVGGMALVVVVNAVMISYALGTFPGLTTDDAYRRGLAYDRTIAADAARQALGWRAELSFQPAEAAAPGQHGSQHGGRLALALTDAEGAAIEGAEVVAVLVRPTSRGHDQHLALDAEGGGRYTATLALPLPGQWESRLLARKGEATFQVNQRIIVP